MPTCALCLAALQWGASGFQCSGCPGKLFIYLHWVDFNLYVHKSKYMCIHVCVHTHIIHVCIYMCAYVCVVKKKKTLPPTVGSHRGKHRLSVTGKAIV